MLFGSTAQAAAVVDRRADGNRAGRQRLAVAGDWFRSTGGFASTSSDWSSRARTAWPPLSQGGDDVYRGGK
jgi:hypothetical protein